MQLLAMTDAVHPHQFFLVLIVFIPREGEFQVWNTFCVRAGRMGNGFLSTVMPLLALSWNIYRTRSTHT